jgi:type IV pilus assembly protein PilW
MNARFAEVQTNGRFAVDFLRREMQHAGYIALTYVDYNDESPYNLIKDGATGSTDYGCGAGFATKIEEPVWGSNDAKGLGCIADADYARGDVLVLRRLDTRPTTALAASTLYFRSEFMKGTVFVGTTAPANLQPPVQDYLLKTDVYWIRPWTNSSTESPQVPALVRKTLGTGPAMTDDVIATGIENMQIQYGVSTAAGIRFYNASDPDFAASLWNSVVAIRLWLLARSTTQEPDLTNTSSYTMGDQTVVVNDKFQRQVFPLVVTLRN